MLQLPLQQTQVHSAIPQPPGCTLIPSRPQYHATIHVTRSPKLDCYTALIDVVCNCSCSKPKYILPLPAPRLHPDTLSNQPRSHPHLPSRQLGQLYLWRRIAWQHRLHAGYVLAPCCQMLRDLHTSCPFCLASEACTPVCQGLSALTLLLPCLAGTALANMSAAPRLWLGNPRWAC